MCLRILFYIYSISNLGGSILSKNVKIVVPYCVCFDECNFMAV
jgi:hypothetical protein